MPDRIGRLWRNLPKPVAHELRGYLRPLVARSKPSDKVSWQQAILATEAWFTGAQASSAAVAEWAKRQHGKGRRPNLKAVTQRDKRQGLGLGTHLSMLRSIGLDELETSRTKAPTPSDLVARLRAGARNSGA